MEMGLGATSWAGAIISCLLSPPFPFRPLPPIPCLFLPSLLEIHCGCLSSHYIQCFDVLDMTQFQVQFLQAVSFSLPSQFELWHSHYEVLLFKVCDHWLPNSVGEKSECMQRDRKTRKCIEQTQLDQGYFGSSSLWLKFFLLVGSQSVDI